MLGNVWSGETLLRAYLPGPRGRDGVTTCVTWHGRGAWRWRCLATAPAAQVTSAVASAPLPPAAPNRPTLLGVARCGTLKFDAGPRVLIMHADRCALVNPAKTVLAPMPVTPEASHGRHAHVRAPTLGLAHKLRARKETKQNRTPVPARPGRSGTAPACAGFTILPSTVDTIRTFLPHPLL